MNKFLQSRNKNFSVFLTELAEVTSHNTCSWWQVKNTLNLSNTWLCAGFWIFSIIQVAWIGLWYPKYLKRTGSPGIQLTTLGECVGRRLPLLRLQLFGRLGFSTTPVSMFWQSKPIISLACLILSTNPTLNQETITCITSQFLLHVDHLT